MQRGGGAGEPRAARTMAVTAAAGVTRTRWWPGRLAWTLWALAMLGLAVCVWLDQLLRQTGRPKLAVLNPSAISPVLGAVIVATVEWPAE